MNAPVTVPRFLCKVSVSSSRMITPLHSLWAGLRTELQNGFWPAIGKKKTELFERKLTERSARLDYVPVPWLLCADTFGTTPLPQTDFKWPELCSWVAAWRRFELAEICSPAAGSSSLVVCLRHAHSAPCTGDAESCCVLLCALKSWDFLALLCCTGTAHATLTETARSDRRA